LLFIQTKESEMSKLIDENDNLKKLNQELESKIRKTKNKKIGLNHEIEALKSTHNKTQEILIQEKERTNGLISEYITKVFENENPLNEGERYLSLINKK
jgi:predicted  nucleic acid-binding Zn-ribbon protein